MSDQPIFNFILIITKRTKIVDPDEMAHYDFTHLQCLPSVF